MSKHHIASWGLALGAALCLSAGPAALTAHAADEAESVVVEGQLRPDGSLEVVETITFAGDAPRQVVQRLATTGDLPDGAYQQYTISEVKATADGADLTPAVTDAKGAMVVTVEGAKAGKKPIVISYKVVGATSPAPANGPTQAGTTLSWPLLQGLSVGAKQVEGRVRPAAPITFVDCESGPKGGLQPCGTFQGGQQPDADPQFTDGPRAADEVVVLSFGQPTNSVASTQVVKHHWSLDRAFSVNPTTLLAALAPLLLGGAVLWALHRRTGRDLSDPRRMTPVAEFRPVGPGESAFTVVADVRPGHVGTVADERVDPVDVTATLLDLAVRGWLRIIELPRESEFKSRDWTFERLTPEGGDESELRAYERQLRDAVAPDDGDPATVSAIAERVAPVIPEVQSSLYDDVVARGWFDHRPDQTRSRWSVLGWSALVLAVLAGALLVAFTTHGLLAIALGLLAVGLLLVAQEMPRRTLAGSSLLGGLSALSSQLMAQPTDTLPAGHELTELSRVLPYAVVLGGSERWLQALVERDLDDDPDEEVLDWYRGPEGWHLGDLPDSINSLLTTITGKLFQR